ncbi:capsular biosynthesis protein [Campylobacter lari]|uniref:HAD hydrolase family protein n=1 Tax=Campylobacter subantarcticus TaxID=497724 RepID=A0ABW9N4V3_9BACT|nr:HAD hydrolase family protein [Campylobacter subantarcticus]EAL3939739.1 capsular biosynthesis protein [Campylobacter lari]MPB99259.1 HAD hydrolase family protein [Campylobacter subantarcticus]
MKNIIIDLDGTLTLDTDVPYKDKPINTNILRQLCYYKELGFKVTIFTSRNMRTYQGDIEKIKHNTLPIIVEWLDKHKVPYDDIIVGKPWCGYDGFYVDDKAIRPSEFAKYSYEEIIEILQKENPYKDGGNR